MNEKESISFDVDELSRHSSLESSQLFESGEFGDICDLLDDFEKKRDSSEEDGQNKAKKIQSKETESSLSAEVFKDEESESKTGREQFEASVSSPMEQDNGDLQIDEEEETQTKEQETKVSATGGHFPSERKLIDKTKKLSKNTREQKEEEEREEEAESIYENTCELTPSSSHENGKGSRKGNDISDVKTREEATEDNGEVIDSISQEKRLINQDRKQDSLCSIKTKSKLVENDANSVNSETNKVIKEKHVDNDQIKLKISVKTPSLLNAASDVTSNQHETRLKKSEIGFDSDSSLDVDFDESDSDVDELIDATEKMVKKESSASAEQEGHCGLSNDCPEKNNKIKKEVDQNTSRDDCLKDDKEADGWAARGGNCDEKNHCGNQLDLVNPAAIKNDVTNVGSKKVDGDDKNDGNDKEDGKRTAFVDDGDTKKDDASFHSDENGAGIAAYIDRSNDNDDNVNDTDDNINANEVHRTRESKICEDVSDGGEAQDIQCVNGEASNRLKNDSDDNDGENDGVFDESIAEDENASNDTNNDLNERENEPGDDTNDADDVYDENDANNDPVNVNNIADDSGCVDDHLSLDILEDEVQNGINGDDGNDNGNGLNDDDDNGNVIIDDADIDHNNANAGVGDVNNENDNSINDGNETNDLDNRNARSDRSDHNRAVNGDDQDNINVNSAISIADNSDNQNSEENARSNIDVYQPNDGKLKTDKKDNYNVINDDVQNNIVVSNSSFQGINCNNGAQSFKANPESDIGDFQEVPGNGDDIITRPVNGSKCTIVEGIGRGNLSDSDDGLRSNDQPDDGGNSVDDRGEKIPGNGYPHKESKGEKSNQKVEDQEDVTAIATRDMKFIDCSSSRSYSTNSTDCESKRNVVQSVATIDAVTKQDIKDGGSSHQSNDNDSNDKDVLASKITVLNEERISSKNNEDCCETPDNCKNLTHDVTGDVKNDVNVNDDGSLRFCLSEITESTSNVDHKCSSPQQPVERKQLVLETKRGKTSIPSSKENTDTDEKSDVQDVKDSVNNLLKRLLKKSKERESDKEESDTDKRFSESRKHEHGSRQETEIPQGRPRARRGPVPLPRRKASSESLLEIENGGHLETDSERKEVKESCDTLKDFLTDDVTDFQPLYCSTPISPRSPRKEALVIRDETIEENAEEKHEKHKESDDTNINLTDKVKFERDVSQADSNNTKVTDREDVLRGFADKGTFGAESTTSKNQSDYAENVEEESIYATSDNEFIGKLSKYKKYIGRQREPVSKQLLARTQTASEHRTKYTRTDHDDNRKRDYHMWRRSRSKTTDLQKLLQNHKKRTSIADWNDLSGLSDMRDEDQRSREYRETQYCNQATGKQTQQEPLTFHNHQHSPIAENSKHFSKTFCYYRDNRKYEADMAETLSNTYDKDKGSHSDGSEKSYKIYSGNFDHDGYEVPVDNFIRQGTLNAHDKREAQIFSDQSACYEIDDFVRDFQSDENSHNIRTFKVDSYTSTDDYQSHSNTIGYTKSPKKGINAHNAVRTAWLESAEHSYGNELLHEKTDPRHQVGTFQVIRFPLTHQGLGIVLGSHPDIIVKEVIVDSDAYRDGRLEAGDRLLSINGYNLTIASLDQAKSVLRKLQDKTTERFATIRFLRDSHRVELDDFDSTIDKSVTLPLSPNESVSPIGGHSNWARQDGKESTPPDQDTYLSSLRKDLNLCYHVPPFMPSTQVYTPPDTTCQNCKVSGISNGRHHDGLLLIAPDSKVHLSKLESALSYLGLHLTELQKCALRNQLRVDAQGYVVYNEFAQQARLIYNSSFCHGESLRYSSKSSASPLPDIVPHSHIHNAISRRMDEMLTEKDHIKNQITKIKASISKRANKLNTVERELAEVRKDLEKVRQRRTVLLKKNEELDRAKLKTKSKVNNYKYEISSLEQELHRLKAANVPVTSRAVTKCAAVEKQIQDLVLRLRNVEKSNKNFHQVTQKLISFAYKVQRVTGDESGKRVGWSTSASSSDHTYQAVAEARANPPKGIRKVGKREQLLSNEAQRIITTVEGLLTNEALPYGWEEAYTDKGERFFMNHLTGTTTWIHPLTKREITRPRRGHLGN